MKKLENLTKGNFWNELESKYPKGLKVFDDWIDEYKEANNWVYLFKKDWWFIGDVISESDGNRSRIVRISNGIKYHELPLAMQLGIFQQFAFENGLSSGNLSFDGEYKEAIENIIQDINGA